MTDFDIDSLRDPRPPSAGERERNAVLRRAARLRRRARLVRAGLVVGPVAVIALAGAGLVARDDSDPVVVAEQQDERPNAEALDGSVALCFDVPAASNRTGSSGQAVDVRGLPTGVPPLLVQEADGDIWVVDDSTATLWVGAAEERSGYMWSRWAPDGSVYASRLGEEDAVLLDHLLGPGQVEQGVVRLAYTVKADAPAGYCAINGYLSSFGITDAGLVLVDHRAGPIPHSCPALLDTSQTTTPWRCDSPEGIAYEVRASGYSSEGEDLGIFFGGYGSIVSDAGASSAFVVRSGDRAGVIRPGSASGCCAGGQQGSVFAISPDGTQLAFVGDGTVAQVSGVDPPVDEAMRLWEAPGVITALAWTGDWIAVAHDGAITIVSVVDGGAYPLTGWIAGDEVIGMDFAMGGSLTAREGSDTTQRPATVCSPVTGDEPTAGGYSVSELPPGFASAGEPVETSTGYVDMGGESRGSQQFSDDTGRWIEVVDFGSGAPSDYVTREHQGAPIEVLSNPRCHAPNVGRVDEQVTLSSTGERTVVGTQTFEWGGYIVIGGPGVIVDDVLLVASALRGPGTPR